MFKYVTLSHNLRRYMGSLEEKQAHFLTQAIIQNILIFREKGLPPLPQVFASVDEALATSLAKTQEHKPCCTKGCAGCCHMTVSACPDEGRIAARYAKKNGIVLDVPRLILQAKADDIQRWEGMSKDDARCVFLDEKDECSIYEVRPINCRTALTITPREECCVHGNIRDNAFMVIFSAEAMASVYHSACWSDADLLPNADKNFHYWVLKYYDPTAFATAF